MAGPPCRLFMTAARDVPVAAVFRRGPSRWTQVIRWDMDRDEFTDGAWLKGRIYEERCDLSPDGELLVYFCHAGRMRPGYTGEVEGADWSGYDHQRRLIFGREGKLHRRTHGRDQEIVDLNDRRPNPLAAPDWARRPLSGRRGAKR